MVKTLKLRDKYRLGRFNILSCQISKYCLKRYSHVIWDKKFIFDIGTFITSRLYIRTFCDIRLDTEGAEVTES